MIAFKFIGKCQNLYNFYPQNNRIFCPSLRDIGRGKTNTF